MGIGNVKFLIPFATGRKSIVVRPVGLERVMLFSLATGCDPCGFPLVPGRGLARELGPPLEELMISSPSFISSRERGTSVVLILGVAEICQC